MSSKLENAVWEILTYDGYHVDIVINYIALVVVTLPFVALLHTLPSEKYGNSIRMMWVPLLGFLFVFQVTLCLSVHCVGISVVWSALCTFHCCTHARLYPHSTLSKPLLHNLLAFSCVCTLSAWAYYAITEDALTTIAHMCAAVLGGVLAGVFISGQKLYIRHCDDRREREGETRGLIRGANGGMDARTVSSYRDTTPCVKPAPAGNTRRGEAGIGVVGRN